MRTILINVFLFLVLFGGDPTGVNAEQLRDTFRRGKGSTVVDKKLARRPAQLSGCCSCLTLILGRKHHHEGRSGSMIG